MAPPLPTSNDTLRGTVRSIRVHPGRGEGSWCVGSLELDDGGTAAFVGADLDALLVGTPVYLTGRWETHRRFGPQLRVESFRSHLPERREAIIRYLASNIAHMGPKRCEQVVDALGLGCLERLAEAPEEVLTVFSGRLGDRIVAGVREWAVKHSRDDGATRLMVRLMEMGLSLPLARRVQRHFAAQGSGEHTGQGSALELGDELSPYELTVVAGIGFETADQLAGRLGIRAADPRRIEAGIEHVLERAMRQGDSGLPERLLALRSRTVLRLSGIEPAQRHVRHMVERGRLVEFDGLVYLPQVREQEERLARHVVRLSRLHRTLDAEDRLIIDSSIGSAGLSNEQGAAIRSALAEGLHVLTGGPGSGKTRTLRGLVDVAKRLDLDCRLAAPTGKAASRLAEMTGHPATTIHRLLGVPQGDRAPKPVDADIVVVDEMSMADVPTTLWLLDHISDSTTVLLVGDPDQLPSVGHGSVLGDVLRAPGVSRTSLTGIFRQDGESRILENARRLLRGRPLLLDNEPNTDFLWADVSLDEEYLGEDGFPVVDPERPRREQAEIHRRIQGALGFLIRQKGAVPMRDIQVLAPVWRGESGVHALNLMLQDTLNPHGQVGPGIGGGASVRVGDRVIQTHNDYDVPGGLFNGEQGEVLAVDRAGASVRVRFDGRELTVSGAALQHLQLAWAVTVHRAQGSEWPYVILAYHTAHQTMLDRSVLYTAVTRAQNLFILVSNERALDLTRRRGAALAERHTGLERSIREGMERLGLLESADPVDAAPEAHPLWGGGPSRRARQGHPHRWGDIGDRQDDAGAWVLRPRPGITSLVAPSPSTTPLVQSLTWPARRGGITASGGDRALPNAAHGCRTGGTMGVHPRWVAVAHGLSPPRARAPPVGASSERSSGAVCRRCGGSGTVESGPHDTVLPTAHPSPRRPCRP